MTADSAAEAWVVRPAGDGAHPGVLFIMDAFGLRSQIAAMMERIASWGYVVLAPNIFHRAGTIAELAPTTDLRAPGALEAYFAVVRPRLQSLSTDAVRADLGAYVAALQGLGGVRPGPLGVTGYCLGARLALVTACAYADSIAAVGGWHGGGLATEDPSSPHLGLGSARAAFAFGHATNDQSMPPEAVGRLGAALERARLRHSNEVFPGAHGYTMADTSVYSAEADALHWERLEALLEENL